MTLETFAFGISPQLTKPKTTPCASFCLFPTNSTCAATSLILEIFFLHHLSDRTQTRLSRVPRTLITRRRHIQTPRGQPSLFTHRYPHNPSALHCSPSRFLPLVEVRMTSPTASLLAQYSIIRLHIATDVKNSLH